MTQFNKISDEELAAYLEGILSDEGSARVEAAMDMDMFEILNVSRRAMAESPAESAITLPTWENVDAALVHPMYEPLAMAGFLGENHTDEETDNDDE